MADKSINSEYNETQLEFVGKLAESKGDYNIVFPALSRVFESVFELKDTQFAVLLFDKLGFVDRLEVVYLENLYKQAPILEEAIEQLNQNPADSPVLLKCAGKHSLVVPIQLESASYGYILVFCDNAPEGYKPGSAQMQIISKIVYLIALVCHGNTSDARFDHYSMNDYLTELPNRSHMYEAIVYSLQMAEVFQRSFALLLIKVNGLKNINDSLGIITGDMALREMGALIKTAVSQSILDDVDMDVLVGRMSGGDFIALLPMTQEGYDENYDKDTVRAYCDAIIEKTKDAIEVNGHKLYMSTNIGASVYPYHVETAEELLRKSDLAKSVAKHNGPSSYMIYEHFMDGDAEKILFLTSNLPVAIANNQFELFYQAQADIAENRIMGAEALIRWRHPKKGMIYPGDFISFAEKNAYGIHIDKMVLDMVCDQINIWAQKGINLIVSANISPRHFTNGLICETVKEVLARKGVEPHRLKIELLESILVEDFDFAVKVIGSLRELGVSVALDDFGTGYSSLEYVAMLPLDYLKVDRTFSMHLDENPGNKIILETIMTLARGMGVKTIAEGVESIGQLSFLREIGCDIAQGYFINKPMDVKTFEEFLLGGKIWRF